jgi:hypothetical protein
MATFLNKALSLAVVVLYVVAAYRTGGGEAAFKTAFGLLLPLACIWFSEPLGGYTGTIRGQLMTSYTPVWLVCAGGWLVLVGVPVIVLALRATM